MLDLDFHGLDSIFGLEAMQREDAGSVGLRSNSRRRRAPPKSTV